MVYCGKPSRGCQMCRTRRIKCDETKPTCTQCQKSRRICPGYKDDFDLVFRNETQATEKRAKKSSSKLKRTGSQALVPLNQQRGPATASSGQDAAISTFAAGSRSSYVHATLDVPVDQIASNFFFANFVSVPHNGDSKGFLDYMIPLVNGDMSNKHLTLAFSAASLAALGNRPNGKMLLFKAQEQYSRAIRHVNEALRDPVEQKTDQTLAAVLLLGLYETILSRRTAVAAWGSHIDGAVMIVKMRGKKQLRTRLGNALFTAVRSQMIINSMTTGKKPDWGADLWTADANGRDEMSDIVNRLALQVAELRCEVNSLMTRIARTTENINLVLDVMRRSRDLEQGFLDWMAQLPEVWRVKTVAWVDNISSEDLLKSEVYPGKIDIYSDVWIASVWSLARVSRLFISGALMRCAAWVNAPLDYRTTPEYAYAARLGVDVVNEIIASVPYHLGWTANKEFTKQFGLAGGEGFACGNDQNAPRSLGAYVHTWPAFSAYCSDFVTDTQRTWLRGRLSFIADVMGINQAATLSCYQLRLPSMSVKRDMMILAALQPNVAAMGASTPPSNPSSPAQYPSSAIPSSNTDSPPTTTAYLPTSTSAPTYLAAYRPSASTASASASTHPPSNASASAYPIPNNPILNSSTFSPPTTFQFPQFLRQESPPDEHLLEAFQDVERKQREQWEKERQKRALEEKKGELVDAATGGDAMLAEMIEKYLAVGMFDE